MSRRAWLLATGWLIVVAVYAGLSRLWTNTESPWYRSLTEPAWQPPDLVFGIIWPLNYLALAVVGVLVARRHSVITQRMLAVFVVSVVFALGWSYLFGQQQSLIGSAIALTVAAALTWVLFGLAAQAGKWYAAGLVVYALWMTLAASLSIGFVVLN